MQYPLDDQVILCRCEGVSLGQVKDAIKMFEPTSLRELKLVTRLSMGMCQGRVCRPIVERVGETLFGTRDLMTLSSRVPIRPVRMGHFVRMANDDE